MLRKQRPAERNGLGRICGVEAVGQPRFFTALDDERAGLLIESVCVDGEPDVFGLLEQKGERIERQRGAEPYKTTEAPIQLRAEGVRVRRAHAAVDAVTTNQ